MDIEESVETLYYTAYEAWNEVYDDDMKAGIALVLGKYVTPDKDSDFQRWVGRLMLLGGDIA